MSAKKKKTWKILLIILCLLAPVVVLLGLGDRGLIHLYRTEMERQAYVEKIRELARENEKLMEEIRRLRTDMKHIESVARKELNVIKENEIIYVFGKEERRNNRLKGVAPKAEHADENEEVKEEVGKDGDNG